MHDHNRELSPLKRAFLAVQSLQAQVDELQAVRTEPIAVVGMACRFPGAPNLDRYWELLAGGIDAIGERPANRWSRDLLDEADVAGRMATRWGGFLDAPDTFDAPFFGIAPREAVGMDPQQRLFLEVCWEALEHAGIAADRLAGRPVGVFAGAATFDYASMQLRGGDLGALGTHYGSGIAHSVITGRVAYLLGLSGPAVTVDTACSSSLVAIHLACQSLRSGECEMALAGGVNVIMLPDVAIAYVRAGMTAADGRCKVFDATADGFVRGEGSGVIVLKRLSKAIADGDVIHALIRGTALNQDGASSSLTAPSGPAQEAVIRAAVGAAGLEPSDVSYVEAHGTGTVLGDPIELQAIGAALTPGRADGDDVLVGSVKSNIGHLEASAGVAGVIKVILSLRNEAIPASLHFKTPNPMIPWDRLAVRVPTTLTPWRPASGTRNAGVSSFGFSGTNAHVIVSEPPVATEPAQVGVDRPSHVLCLSAATEHGLRELATRHMDHLRRHPELATADVAHTTNVGRAHLRHRAAIVIGPRDRAADRLSAFVAGGEPLGWAASQIQSSDGPRVVFLFSGQGSQYVGMGRTLFDTQPSFRRALMECDALLGAELQPGILDVLYPLPGTTSRIDETRYTQPALFAFEYALAKMWMSWGIRPAALMGHSLGEFVAATLSGILSLEDALRLVAARGRLGQRLSTAGKMAAVLTDRTRLVAAIAALGDRVCIAAFNAPESSVISGPPDAVDAVIARLAREGVESRVLPISNAFHSKAVEPMMAEFESAAAAASYGAPRLPVYSNLFGRRAVAGEMENARYWVDHLREPVQFAAGFASALADGYTTFLEVGPHTTLVGLGRQCAPEVDGAFLPTLRRDYDDWGILLGSLGQLFVAGAPVDWTAFDADYTRRRLVLPTYPFERQRYMTAVGQRRLPPARSASSASAHPLLSRRLASPFIKDTIFESELSLQTTPWLSDHRVLGAAVLPATAYLEAIWSAATRVHGSAVRAIEDIDIYEALVTPEDAARTVQLSLSAPENGRASFRVVSADNPSNTDAWRSHASGTVSLGGDDAPAPAADLDAIRRRCASEVPAGLLYEAVAKRGVDTGPSFRGLVELHQGPQESFARIQATDTVVAEGERYHVHPALLDAALHAVAAAIFDASELAVPGDSLMPIALEHFRVFTRPAPEMWTHVAVRPTASRTSPVVDVRVYDAAGTVVVEFWGLQFARASAAAWANPGSSRVDEHLYEIAWRPVPVEAPSTSESRRWTVPAPADLVATAAGSISSELRDRMRRYADGLDALDEVSRELVTLALANLGWAPAAGTRIDTETLADTLGIVSQHRRLFERLLAILAEDGILRRDGNDWTVLQPLPCGEHTISRLHALRDGFPEGGGELGLLTNCGPELAACLSGRVDPLSLLFPGGSFDAANELYRRSPSALALNAMAREAVRQFVASSSAGDSIRVLEVGAGTGGTTASLLPEFPTDRTKYVYTDLSPLFLARAEEQFTAHPFVEYRLLDIEREPAAQGFARGTFDLVVAANVLHATRDLAETLAHVRQLVRPGGMLLLLEGTRPQRWIDLTFGLTDGWWRFSDRTLRPDYPLMDLERWASALISAGFDSPDAAPRPGGVGALDHNLMIVTRAAETARDRWIVFADEGGVGDAVAASLRVAGRDAVVVKAGEIAPSDAAPIAGIVHLSSLDAVPSPTATLADLHAAEDRGCRSLLSLVQETATCDRTTASRVVVVTRGARAVRGNDVVAPVHAALWGLAGTIRLEHPDLACACIDLDPSAAVDPAALTERILDRQHAELAVRDGEWRAPRLVRRAAADPRTRKSQTDAVKLVNKTPGVLDGLTFVPATVAAPGPGEVVIRVEASALNFRDVLVAMGFFPGVGETEGIGGECAGTVLAVGPGVTRLRSGDSVVAMAPGALGSHVVALADLVMRRPSSLSVDDVVTIPNAFVTAWHSLYDVAHLGHGDVVLIHAGAGGVGMAAIQLAKRVGATIIATAGSPQKRAFLTSCGVHHVLDSRSLAYADQIAAITAGRGVDVVLNSLADDHIERSLSTLADGGRFVELGKRGVWAPERVRAFRPTVKYDIVDLAAVGVAQPAVIADLLQRVGDALAEGGIAPLPITAFPSDDVIGAFRYMAQAKHIGKIVVRRAVSTLPVEIRANATYLITGGTGGLGMATAAWLIEQGAGHVVLMSRRPADDATQQTVDGWNARGPRATVLAGDVAAEADVRRVLSHISEALPPLRGIVHSAGVLRDAVIVGQPWEQFATTFGPKVDGTWHLHRLTATTPLDFFVLYSSISSLFGSPGQSNHAAANAFLDSFAHYRHSLGLPALSINWGAWDDVGAAMARNVAGRIGAQGMGTMSPAEGIAALDRLFGAPSVQVAVVPADWTTFARQFGSGHLRTSLLAELSTEHVAVVNLPAPTPPARAPEAPIKNAAPAVRWELLGQRMRALATRVLGLDPSMSIDVARPLQEMGLDSLMAVELRNLMKTELGLDRAPAATIVFDYPSVNALTQYVGGSVFGWTSDSTEPGLVAREGETDWLDELEKLSPEEADRLLADRMNGGR